LLAITLVITKNLGDPCAEFRSRARRVDTTRLHRYRLHSRAESAFLR
jgi:hypothetical protein